MPEVRFCPCSARVVDGEHQGPCGIPTPEQDLNVCPSCDLGLPYGCNCPTTPSGRTTEEADRG